MTSPLQQKIKIAGPSVVTANRLGDGAVVYRTARNQWTTDLAAAAVVSNTNAASELLTSAKADGRSAVDVYVAPVKVEDDQVVPGNLRELIRMRGPTIDLPYSYGA
jgi:uncharacterized protein DUF2849